VAANKEWIMDFVPYEYEFFVIEAEYPKLQAACPGEFPFPYSKFVAIREQRLRERLQQKLTHAVYVEVADFIAYCTKRGIPPNENARIKYAQFVGNCQIPT
jgi:hypothetical protein